MNEYVALAKDDLRQVIEFAEKWQRFLERMNEEFPSYDPMSQRTQSYRIH